MKILLTLTLVAALSLVSLRAFSAPESIESPETQSAAIALVQGARSAVAPRPNGDDEEPGDVSDEEASRPPTAVADGIYRSSRPSLAALEHLFDLGITRIL